MKDCKVTIEVKNEQIEIRATQITIEEMAVLNGYLQNFVGVSAYKRGKSLDDIKDSLLDIYLAAIVTIEESIQRLKECEDG